MSDRLIEAGDRGLLFGDRGSSLVLIIRFDVGAGGIVHKYY